MEACGILGMSNQDKLSKDLESNPFLNSALPRLTCVLFYRFGSFLGPLNVGQITSRHYLSEHGIKNGGGTSGDNRSNEKQSTTLSKYEGLGSGMAAELMIGFWFGIKVILVIRMVNSLDYCIKELMSRK